MELKIESRNITLAPSERTEIEQRAADLQAFHPETTHIRVQLTRNVHHKKGNVIEALVVASFPRRHTATARKDGESPLEAIRAAFAAATVELKKFREKRAESGATPDSALP
jgi:ribosome-associated translation inhibitor RaiA